MNWLAFSYFLGCKKLLFTMRFVTFCESLKLLQKCFIIESISKLNRNTHLRTYLSTREIKK